VKLRTLLPLAILVAVLTGCSASPSTGTDASTGTGTGTEEASDGGTGAAEPWSECPAIIERLNANEDDPTDYEQADASDFEAPEVGADVLAGACVIRLTVNAEQIVWAITPGDEAFAESIGATLVSEGFVSVGGGVYGLGDEATGRGVLVKPFSSGAGLDAYLVYTTAFAPITEPIVFLGTATE